MGKSIIIVKTKNEADYIKPIIKSNHISNGFILAISEKVKLQLPKTDFIVKSPEDFNFYYDSLKSNYEIMSIIKSWASSFSYDWVEVFSKYEGIDIEIPTRYWLFYEVLYEYLFCLICFRKVILEEKVSTVYYVDDKSINAKIIKHISQQIGVKIKPVIIWQSVILEKIKEIKNAGIIGIKFARDIYISLFCYSRRFLINYKETGNKVIVFYQQPHRFNDVLSALQKISRHFETIVVKIDKKLKNYSQDELKTRYTLWQEYLSFQDIIVLAKNYLLLIIRCRCQAIIKETESLDMKILYLLDKDIRKLILFKSYSYFSFWIMRLRRIASDEKAKLAIVVSREGCFDGRLIAKIMEKYRIPTLSIQTTVLQNTVATEDLCYTKYAAMGEYFKQELLKSGMKEAQIEVTGAVQYDSLGKLDAEQKKKIYIELNLDPKKKVITFVSSQSIGTITTKEKLEIVRKLIDICMNYPNSYQLLVKLHPGEVNAKDSFISFLSAMELKGKCKVVANYDLNNLLDITGLIVTHFSTLIIPSVIQNIPVLVLNLSNAKDGIFFSEYGGVIVIRNIEELTPAISNVFSNKLIQDKLMAERETFVRMFAYKNDSQSGDRVCNLCNSMIKGSNVVTN